MKANGGCVSPRNALDSVDFAVSSNRKQKGGGGGPVMTSANRNSKNNRLRQKESLLYNRSRSGGAASGPVSGIVPKRSKLPDEADWGVAPRRNAATTRIGSNKKTYEKTSLRDEAHQLQTQRPRTPNRLIKQHMENAPRSSEGGPLAKMTPIEHLRNERRQKPLSTTRTIALTRARTTEVTPKPRPKSQGRSRRELEKAQRKPQVTAMADVTSRHRNHPQHSSHREYGVDATRSPIFQSTRVSSPLSAYPDGPTLFEEAKKEQVRKERRRSQLVDEALRIRDQQEDNSIEESMLDYYRRDPVEEDCWDAPHRVPGKAALDPVEQFRDTIELDYNEAVQKETIHIPGVREKPQMKTVTNWGITQIFSDLSCSSTGPSNLSKNSPPPALAPSNPTPFASSLTSASQTLQQALAAAKSQIYPSSFGNSRNANPTALPVRVPSQEPKPTATTVEIGYRHKLQDDSTTSEIRPTEPQNTIQSYDNTSKQTGRGTSIPAKLPTPQRGHTAPTAHVKTQSPRPQRPEVTHRRQKIKSQSNFIGQAIDNQAIQKDMRPSVSSTPLSRPKSPDTMRMLETTRHFPRTRQGENRRSRSKTPEGLRNRQQNLGQKARPRTPDRFARPATPDDLKSRKSTTPLRDRLLRGGDTRSASTTGSGDHQSNDASSYQRSLTPTFPFLRSRSQSITPSRDRRREPASAGVSTISSRQEQEKPRSVTPNRLLISQRRQRTPGQVLGDTRQFADRAEEQLNAIQQKRETEEKLIAIQKELSGEGHGDYQHHIDSVGTERSLSQLVGGEEMERKERKSSVKRFFGVLGGKSDKKRNSGQSPRNMGTSATLGLLRGDSTGARGRGVGPAGSSALGSAGGGNANLPPGRQSSQQIAPESPRESLSMRWFGRKHYEVPRVAAFEAGSTSTGAVRVSHLRMQHRIVDSYDGRQDFSRGSSQELLKEDASYSVASSRQHSMRSDNVLAHMTTFDSLMKTIESEKEKAVPEAEFAVVELGDEDNVIRTHTIMMNPDQVEGQLVARGLKKHIQRYSHPSKKKADTDDKTPTIGNMRPAHDDSDLRELEVTQSFANQLQGLQQLQKPPYQYNVPRGTYALT